MDEGPLSAPFGRQDPSLPQVFGRYLLVQRLSRGGMGEIFLAKHGLAGFEKLAVIKKVLQHLSADEQFISRFVDEAQVAIKLQHVNVAQVFEVGRVGDEYFLALEYVDGRDLRRTLALLTHRRQRLPVDLALFIARELANGLAYAHRRTTSDGASLHLVHCDISPPNVLVSFEGETKVIDFGIAKSVMRGTATDPKIGFGKFGYMAPEQLIRGGVVDHRTDLYAAGVVLFELLTGTRLYEAGPEPDYRALARKVARGEHALPSEIDPGLEPYDDLVATALRPKPDDRYQSAAEFRDAIQQCLVAVNPTISTDQLGAYMRELFADEMAAQRELHERVANARLADFQEQFHTQTIDTVSFAVAQLPLEPPEATGRLFRRNRTTGPNPTTKKTATGPTPVTRTRTGPTPIVKTRTGPTPIVKTRTGPNPLTRWTPAGASPVVEPASIELAPPASDAIDRASELATTGVVGVEPQAEDTSHSRRWIVIPASAAIAVLAAFGLWGISSDDDRAPAAQPIATSVANPTITVEPIPVAPHSPPDRPAGNTAAPADKPPAEPLRQIPPKDGAGALAQPSRQVARDATRRAAHKEVKQPAPPQGPAPFTREQLAQKYQQVQREYMRYKSKFGQRLEKEWGDVMTSIQYVPTDDAGRREVARRLDEFRGRMRE
ncbi:MAG TPA: protein kinase [Kofleriaceae bacterium]|nr:protein kinase [Kofleriaceae bacterium]